MKPLNFTMWFVVMIQLLFLDDSMAAMSEARIKEIFRERRHRANLDTLSARGKASPFHRRRLPDSGDIFSGLHFDQLKCGATYHVTSVGYISFKLKAGGKQCYNEFIGSKSDNCTVGLLCKGSNGDYVTVGTSDPKQGCKGSERMTITDGTEGSMTGCGKFSFKEILRIPRNGGTDLYLSYMGSSDGICLAVCARDVTTRHAGVKQVSSNKHFNGFTIENSCVCGKRNDFGRIVGGTTAMKHEFPWLGAVVFKGPGFGRQPFCGGSLINNRYFLSAAHCFENFNIKAGDIEVVLHAHVMDRSLSDKFPNENDPVYQTVPGWDLPTESDKSEGSIRLEIAEMRSHPLYNIRNADFDISILKFKNPVNFTEGRASPICLPHITDHFNFKNGDTFTIAGWGDPYENAPASGRILQKLDILYADPKTCKRYTFPTKRHLCAGHIQGGKDSCQGDSGKCWLLGDTCHIPQKMQNFCYRRC